MCMDVFNKEKMGDRNDRNVDDDVQILEEHIQKAPDTIKAEPRADEAEIRELAAKMVEAHKAKTAAAAITNSLQQQRLLPTPIGTVNSQNNLSGILNYFSPNNKQQTKVADSITNKAPNVADNKAPLDDESQRGRFGWTTFGEATHIPYIFRTSEKYCAVRILESKLLNKYLSYLHSDIYSCTCIRSYYITEAESKLFNEINVKHCEGQFGRDTFTCKDLVVRLADAKEFYTFLDICYSKLTASSPHNSIVHNKTSDKCGFIRINKESVVPYTIKGGLKYVPLFYFEGETDNLKLKAEKLEGWDLSYLKFCCKVQGIRNELFASETCSVISLNDIKSYFPPGTGFEDYWPSKVMDSQLLVSSKGSGCNGGWTKQPPTPPIVSKPIQNNISNKNTTINTRGNAGSVLHNMLPRIPASSSNLQRVNQPRSVVTSHPVHVSPTSVPSARTITQSMLNAVTSVNGWTGLVAGQPFQAIVSQPNIIQMTPASINIHNQLNSVKTYQRQQQQQIIHSRANSVNASQYPVYSNTNVQATNSHVPQPPPLIRSTSHSNQSNLGVSATYTAASIGVPNSINTYSPIIGPNIQTLVPSPVSTPSLLPQPQSITPPGVINSNNTKYPPALIPVNGSSNNTRDSRGRKPLIPIADAVISNCQVLPYQVQKALIEDKMVPCINFKPYIYSELLMTLPEFVQQYFPNCDVESCRQVLSEVLQVDLYQGNRLQMEILMKNGKCSSVNEEIPLIPVRVIMKFMPQLKYMFNNKNMVIPSSTSHSSEEHSAKKRQRTS